MNCNTTHYRANSSSVPGDPTTAAYFDHYGLYSFGRQPEAIHWDLAQFAGCMSLVTDASPLSDGLAHWSGRFEHELVDALLRRLGIERRAEGERELAAVLLRSLQSREAQIDRVFFDWRGGRDPGHERYPSQPFRELASLLEGRQRLPTHPYWSDAEPCSMHIDEVETIWSAIAERDDWSPFEEKISAIRRMGDAMIQDGAPA